MQLACSAVVSKNAAKKASYCSPTISERDKKLVS